jgi:hypothetical protein
MTADSQTRDPEALLRETFSAHEHVADVPVAALAGAARARADAQRRTRRRWVGTGALAATTALVVAGLMLPRSPFLPSTATPVPSSPLRASVPAGWQVVSSLGVELAVPGEWKLNADDGCHDPVDGTVTFGGGPVAGCGRALMPRFTLVAIAAEVTDPRPQGATHDRGRPTRISGEAATLDRWTFSGGLTELQVVIPGGKVAVELRGTDEALLRRILATVRLVDVDSAGCHAVQPAKPSWDGSRSGPAIPVGHPESIGVCLYRTGRLAASKLLTGAEAARAAAALGRAAPGQVPDQPDSCLDEPEQETAWLYLKDGSLERGGSVTPVRVHYDNCRRRFAVSPGGVSQLTQAMLSTTVGRTGTGYSFSGDVPTG